VHRVLLLRSATAAGTSVAPGQRGTFWHSRSRFSPGTRGGHVLHRIGSAREDNPAWRRKTPCSRGDKRQRRPGKKKHGSPTAGKAVAKVNPWPAHVRSPRLYSAGMGSARDERALLADVIEAAGPDQPTLCEGWDAYDLVAHLVTRERVPKAAPGLIIPKLHGITERAEKATRAGHSFAELLATFRSGPPAWQPSRIPAFDNATNLVEFFVHGEDVRRGGTTPAAPRELSPELTDTLWASVRRMARLAYRRAPSGLVLQRTDGPGRVVARKGEPAVTLAGPAAEILLYAFGRRSAARVEITGDPALVATLAATPVGL
jgi:uncharacterized protein (TIGR03085 family)